MIKRAAIKGLKIAGVVLIGLLLVTAAAAFWLTGTESGSRFALQQAQGMLPAGIDLGTARGRLAGDLELTDVAVAGDVFELTIARLWLEWSPAALLRGRLSIADLGAQGVRYRAVPSDASAAPQTEQAPFSLPERIELPLAVEVQRLSIEDVAAVLAAGDADATEAGVDAGAEADDASGADVDAADAPAAAAASDSAGTAAEPIIVERVLLTDASFVDSRLELASLAIESPLLSATGAATMIAADDYALDANLDWRLRPPDYAELAGETTVGGSLAELVVEQRIAAPYSLTLTGSVLNLLEPNETLALALDLAVDDLALVEVQAGMPDATLRLDARLEGPVDALEANVQASGTDPAQRRFTAALDATVAPEAVTIRALAVRQPGRDGVLEGRGRIALGGETSADLSIRWSALQWPLTGEPVVASPQGTLDFDGPLSGYRLSVDTRLEPSAAPPVDLRLSGTGDLSSIAVTFEAQERDGALAGSVDAVWSPTLRADISLEAEDFDPSPFAADWPGAVDLSLAATANVEGDNVAVTLSRLEASGTLREQPLAVTGEGRFEQTGEPYVATIGPLQASLGDTRLEVSGRIDAAQADLDWRLVSDDLSSVLPRAAGAVTASGRVAGPIPRARVAAHVEGRGLAFDAHRIASLDVDADLDLAGEEPSDLVVTLRDALVAGTAVGNLVVDASGTASAHDISVAVDAEPGRAALVVQGALQDPWGESAAWQFALTEGELGYGSLAPWRLAAPATGRIDAESVDLERQCWQAAEARLCLDARRDAEGLAAALDLDALSFGYFAGFLPEDVGVRGTVSVAARASQPRGETLTADAVVALSATDVTLPVEGGDGNGAIVRIEPSEIRVALNETGARAEAALNLEHGRLNLQASTSAESPSAPLAEQRLAGNLEIMFPDLSFIADFAPTLESIEGRLDGTLDLAGTVGAPAVSGAIALENGAVSMPETGIALTELRASLEGLGRDGIALTASAVSGGGSLNVDGRMSLPGAPLDARIDIEGDTFQVVDNDEARVFVSPDLRVEADAERLTVSGTVHVPRAELTPGEDAPSAVTVTSDQVLLSDEPEAAAASERDLFAEIRVSLGDDVHFAGFGLTARIEGELLVEQEPRTPTTATGELRILDGEYRAYGQGLVIDSGRIYFAGGPITQPALDVRAVRRPREGILVGANVQGTLEAPSFQLISEPPMTQQEQLSWLVLGRSLEEAPEGQGNALSQAALAMGLKGGDFLAKNIGERVGLDQFGIETGSGEAGAPSDPSQAALVVGKYLSPKLYVSYGVGLFTPESVLEMQYEISKNWTVVTQSSGDSTGGDVLYTVEFGQ